MSSDEILHVSAKEIKTGKFIIIDGSPCKVVDVEISAPGKHGAAKMRITGIGIFDGSKKTLLKPSSGDVEVPVIDKKRAQVVSISGSNAQMMDMESYETYDLAITDEFKPMLKAGQEVEIIETMGKKAIMRIVGGT